MPEARPRAAVVMVSSSERADGRARAGSWGHVHPAGSV